MGEATKARPRRVRRRLLQRRIPRPLISRKTTFLSNGRSQCNWRHPRPWTDHAYSGFWALTLRWGYALRSFATPLMRHEIVGVDMDTTRWRRERQVKKLIRRDPIDLILDARLVTQIDGVDPVGQPDIERTQWLAELAAKDGVSYLYLSSARVFSGTLTRARIGKSDQPDARGSGG